MKKLNQNIGFTGIQLSLTLKDNRELIVIFF